MRAAVASHHSKSKINLGEKRSLSFLRASPKGCVTSEIGICSSPPLS